MSSGVTTPGSLLAAAANAQSATAIVATWAAARRRAIVAGSAAAGGGTARVDVAPVRLRSAIVTASSVHVVARTSTRPVTHATASV